MDPAFHPGQDLCGLRLYIDTCVAIDLINGTSQEAVELLRLSEEGWISVNRTDVLDTERTDGQDEDVQAQRLDETADLPESFGPFVFDQSQFDRAVFASGEDESRYHSTFATLFPHVTDRATTRKNHIRDAMHISTAARYGAHAFVTTERRLLNKDEQINELLGIRIWTPEQAHAEAMHRVESTRARHIRDPRRGPLPVWPS